jgi:hypothetical protein
MPAVRLGHVGKPGLRIDAVELGRLLSQEASHEGWQQAQRLWPWFETPATHLLPVLPGERN